MKALIENLMNGNLTYARFAAKRYSWQSIFTYCRDTLGYNERMARATADYLKHKCNFGDYCCAYHQNWQAS